MRNSTIYCIILYKYFPGFTAISSVALDSKISLHIGDMLTMPGYSKAVPKFATVTIYRNTFTATTELYTICTQRYSTKILEITARKQ